MPSVCPNIYLAAKHILDLSVPTTTVIHFLFEAAFARKLQWDIIVQIVTVQEKLGIDGPKTWSVFENDDHMKQEMQALDIALGSR